MMTNRDSHEPISEIMEQECLLLHDDWAQRHTMECEVSRRLTSHPDIEVQNLVVRRIPHGVCLEGRVIMHKTKLDLQALMEGISGLDEIRNHLLMTPEPEVTPSSTSQENQREYAEQGKIEPFDFPHRRFPDF